jgi:hypothetical protein
LRKAAGRLSAKRLLRAQPELAAAVQWTELFWNRLWDAKWVVLKALDKLRARLGSSPTDVWLQVPSVQIE